MPVHYRKTYTCMELHRKRWRHTAGDIANGLGECSNRLREWIRKEGTRLRGRDERDDRLIEKLEGTTLV